MFGCLGVQVRCMWGSGVCRVQVYVGFTCSPVQRVQVFSGSGV